MTVHYFVSDQDQDLAFLAHVVRKANEIREDLGSANELFDDAAHRRLIEGESASAVQADLDRRIVEVSGRAPFEADATTDTTTLGVTADRRLQALAAELDLGPDSLRDTLEAALAIRAGRPQLDCGNDFTCKMLNPELPGWREAVDESLRRNAARGVAGSVSRLAGAEKLREMGSTDAPERGQRSRRQRVAPSVPDRSVPRTGRRGCSWKSSPTTCCSGGSSG